MAYNPNEGNGGYRADNVPEILRRLTCVCGNLHTHNVLRYNSFASMNPTVDDEGSMLAADFVGAPSHGVALVRDLHLAHVHVPHTDLPPRRALAELPVEILVVLSVG